VQLLTEIAPGVTWAAARFNPDASPGRGSYYLPAFEAAARSLGVEGILAPVRSDAEIETIIASLGRERESGLVVQGDAFTEIHRKGTSKNGDFRRIMRI
jgi:putative tryptophan/tyrosine transport system substrate-binding protein